MSDPVRITYEKYVGNGEYEVVKTLLVDFGTYGEGPPMDLEEAREHLYKSLNENIDGKSILTGSEDKLLS